MKRLTQPEVIWQGLGPTLLVDDAREMPLITVGVIFVTNCVGV